MWQKIKRKLAEAGLNGFVYSLVLWIFVSLYAGSMNPITQIDYTLRDIACKWEGGMEWEAGNGGCYKFRSEGADKFRRAFGG